VQVHNSIGYNDCSNGGKPAWRKHLAWNEISAVDILETKVDFHGRPGPTLIVKTFQNNHLIVKLENLAIRRAKLGHLLEVFRARATRNNGTHTAA